MDYMRNRGYTKIYGEETPSYTNIGWQNTGDTHQWCSKHQLCNLNQRWRNTSYTHQWCSKHQLCNLNQWWRNTSYTHQ